jgi:hypothetical protein
MMGYKVLIELKRTLFEMLTGEDWNEKQRKDRPYMDVHNPKTIQPTKESAETVLYRSYDVNLIEQTKEKLSILETTFDIQMSPDQKYESGKEYSKGDIVFAGLNFKDQLNRTLFEMNLSLMEEGYTPNIELDTDLNAYVAKDVIYYGERLVL